MNFRWMSAVLLGSVCAAANAADTKVTLKMATDKGDGAEVGTVTISETRYGLVFTPQLSKLPFSCTWKPCRPGGSLDSWGVNTRP